MNMSNGWFAAAFSVLIAATSGVPAGAQPAGAAQLEAARGIPDIRFVQFQGNEPLWWKMRQSEYRAEIHRRNALELQRYVREDRERAEGRARDRLYDRPGVYYRDQTIDLLQDDARIPRVARGTRAIAGDRPVSRHVNWCASRYRSYRAADNTFQPYTGSRRPCISPHS